MSSVINPRHRQLSSSLEQHPPFKESHLAKHNCRSTDTLRTSHGLMDRPHINIQKFFKATNKQNCCDKHKMVCETDNSATAGLSTGTGTACSCWMSPRGRCFPEPAGQLLHTHSCLSSEEEWLPQLKADLPEDGTWDGNTPSRAQGQSSMFVTKSEAPAKPQDRRRCVPASASAGHRGTGTRYSGSSSQSRPMSITTLVLCCTESTAGQLLPAQFNPHFRVVGQCSQGLVFPSGNATVLSGCCMLLLLPGQPVPLTQTTALFWELFWTPATDLNMPQPLGSAHGCRGCCHTSPSAPTARMFCCQ